MIIVKLCGGLGNQLFQYAAGRALSLINHTELCLDLSWFENIPSSNTKRDYCLKNFTIKASELSGFNKYIAILHSNKILSRTPISRIIWKHYREKSFDFDRDFVSLPDFTYLNGYWQSHLYFESYIIQIRHDLKVKLMPNVDDSKYLPKIDQFNSVSIHFRRGDYVNQKAASAVHGACSMDYYKTAIEYVKSKIDNPNFFVFSDDIEWVKNNFVKDDSFNYILRSKTDSEVHDLMLMSRCKHHIIANSSFSWWAAMLNADENKIVVAPKRWFANSKPTPTLIPESWVRI